MDNLSLIAIILLIVIVYCCINRSQFGATPPPPNLDLSKIKGSWNPGTLSITSGVLEYKPGNLSTNGDLELPYPVLDKNYYRVSIVIGTLTGNRSPITIKSLTGTLYNDNLSSILSTETFFTAESNKTITFNIMATKALNAVYIKVFRANNTDILRIKSVTIQNLSPPAASNLDLSKIKGSWNPGTLSITSGVLEYKPGNAANDGDLELPYPVLDKNYYRVSIVIGTLTGNRSPITIKPLTGTVYNDNLSSILSVQTFIAESNKTITFNIMATKALNAVYIKVTTANKTDILRIKSVTIQKLSPPAAPSALPPPPPPKIAPPPPPTSAGPARAAPLSKEAAAREAELKAKAAQAAQAAAAAVKDNSAAVAKANDVIQKGTAYLTKFKNFADVTTKKHVEAVITLAQKIVADNGKVQTNNTAILNDLKNKYPDLKK